MNHVLTPEKNLYPVNGERQEYQRKEKLDASKNRNLINALKDTFPETVLISLLERFPRVYYGVLTPKKLSHMAFLLFAYEHQACSNAGLLEGIFREIDGEL